MGKKRSYPGEFREYVSKLIVQDGRRIVDVSKELKIPYDTLQKWVASYRKQLQESEKATQNKLLTASEYKELYEAELQAKLDLQEENEILKKAMHIFTQAKG
ncbi:transposase [Pseudogracilibacillus auburnensis]|uniref:Transposase n=1 Tax=Pseudogracilibacillus auburnensis TaxID=1494959 RepID=A0A2V3VTQ7_9BACI|nr:transposase [Pseudogracilibacillus auburnensis]PXW85292.1 transposase [Pseudogracilibacillus auburnensis]